MGVKRAVFPYSKRWFIFIAKLAAFFPFDSAQSRLFPLAFYNQL